MGYFRDQRSGGRRDFGGGRRDFGDRGERTMHHATCDNCGKDCQVPFKPTGSKPVFCSDCFERNGGGDNDARRFTERPQRRNDFPDRNRRPDFGGNRNGDRREQPQNRDQFNQLNAKLDKILSLLQKTQEAPLSATISTPSVESFIEPKKDITVDEIDMSAQQPAPVEKKKKKTKKTTTPAKEKITSETA